MISHFGGESREEWGHTDVALSSRKGKHDSETEERNAGYHHDVVTEL